MSQQSARKEYNTFVKGIITEAGPLTFPEDASLDEENCVLNRDGSRQRRLGMDFEEDFVLRNVTVTPTDAIACWRWFNVGNDSDVQFAVVQAGSTVLVFDATASSISGNLIATLDLSAYCNGDRVLGTTSGMGYFFICTGEDHPLYLSYDGTTVTVSQATIKIRDLFGVDDGLDINEQPVATTSAHQYNLKNQGWTDTHIGTYFAAAARYPSNTNIWWVGKDASDNFDPALMDKMEFGTTPAPRGRYIIDAFARSTDRKALTGDTGIPDDIETGYPTCVGFAFERVFYSGIQSVYNGSNEYNPNFSGFIFYTRTLRSAQDFGRCYSDADPTSEVDSELVATDGGYINIPNSGQIYKLMAKGDMLLVFAEHGIWAVTGDEGGFRGTSYQVVKLSSFGVLSPYSIVDTEDSAMYWNRGGIYGIVPDQSTGRLTAANITETTIQTLYNEIDQAPKKHCVGSFDPVNRRVSWMYNDDSAYTGNTFVNKYNKELVYDLVLGAFYKNSISSYEDPSPYIAAYLETPDFLLRAEGVRTRGDSVTKYLTVQFIDPATNAASLSFAYYRSPSLRDWVSSDGVGVSYTSYLITGYETMGESMRNKTAQKLITHFKRTELTAVDNGSGEAVPDNPSSCLVQSRWDWSDSSNSGKWSEQFQAYRPMPYIMTIGEDIDYGYEVITNKTTIPGRGRALSIMFTSDADKDFYLYGWAIKFVGQQSV